MSKPPGDLGGGELAPWLAATLLLCFRCSWGILAQQRSAALASQRAKSCRAGAAGSGGWVLGIGFNE